MIALLQRAIEARIDIDGRTVAAIGPGILALIGFHKDDAPEQTGRMAERILGYRLFADEEGKMNCSVVDTAVHCCWCRNLPLRPRPTGECAQVSVLPLRRRPDACFLKNCAQSAGSGTAQWKPGNSGLICRFT